MFHPVCINFFSYNFLFFINTFFWYEVLVVAYMIYLIWGGPLYISLSLIGRILFISLYHFFAFNFCAADNNIWLLFGQTSQWCYSDERLREPIPSNGRKEPISLAQKTEDNVWSEWWSSNEWLSTQHWHVYFTIALMFRFEIMIELLCSLMACLGRDLRMYKTDIAKFL